VDEAEGEEAIDAPTASPQPAPSDEVTRPAGPQADLFAGVSVQRLPDGRLVLEAQPEAAATLASLFEGMAALLKQSAR
jgi:hypothetical protein